jgi:uncharacterized protein with von Willebrand factor type A (vWA) domain
MYRSDYENFIKNSVWKEIQDTLKETIDGLLDDLVEIVPQGDGIAEVARQQGRLKMAKFVLALPEDILREITENERKVKEEGENNGRE